jgi:hypothetical protein
MVTIGEGTGHIDVVTRLGRVRPGDGQLCDF